MRAFNHVDVEEIEEKWIYKKSVSLNYFYTQTPHNKTTIKKNK